MYFDRFIRSDPRDVRTPAWYIYKCDVCEEETEFRYVSGFDTTRIRKCPHCKSFGTQDKLISLKTQITTLTQQKTELEMEIDRLCKEVEQVQTSAIDN